MNEPLKWYDLDGRAAACRKAQRERDAAPPTTEPEPIRALSARDLAEYTAAVMDSLGRVTVSRRLQ